MLRADRILVHAADRDIDFSEAFPRQIADIDARVSADPLRQTPYLCIRPVDLPGKSLPLGERVVQHPASGSDALCLRRRILHKVPLKAFAERAFHLQVLFHSVRVFAGRKPVSQLLLV